MAMRADDLVADVAYHSGERLHLGIEPVADAEKLIGSIDKERNDLVRNRIYGIEEGEVVFPGYGPDNVELACFTHLPQRHDSSVRDRNAPVRYYRIDVRVRYHSEALAVGAIAFRRVERERVRLRLLEGKSRVGIDEMLREMAQLSSFKIEDSHGALSALQSGHHGIAYAFPVIAGRDKLVDHELDEMRFVAVHERDHAQVLDLPVDPALGVALPSHLGEELLVMSFPSADYGRKKVAFPPVVILQYEVHDLLVRVADHLLS